MACPLAKKSIYRMPTWMTLKVLSPGSFVFNQAPLLEIIWIFFPEWLMRKETEGPILVKENPARASLMRQCMYSYGKVHQLEVHALHRADC